MKRRFVVMSLFVLLGAVFSVAAARRPEPVARLTAKSAEMTSPARLALRPVDIEITSWSTDQDHRLLGRTLLEKGEVAFLDVLCGYGSKGTISVMGNRDITIRYAWETRDRDGGSRIYLATDEPIVLGGAWATRYPDVERLTFVELRLNAYGEGEGKLSDALRLSFDESRNLIELRDYARRPLNLVTVRSIGNIDE